MKALFTLFSLVFLLPLGSQAQVPDSLGFFRIKPFFSGGIHGGVNVSSLSNFNHDEMRMGMTGGLFAEYHVRRALGISAEILYSEQGTTFQHNDLILKKLTVPFMLTLQDNGFSVQAGMYVSQLLRAKTGFGSFSKNVTKHLEKFDSGFCVGLSHRFHGKTLIGVRYYLGVDNQNKSLTDNRTEFYNSTLQITGGYHF